MARLLISNTASLTLSPPAPSSRALLNPPHVPISPATRFSSRQARGLTVVTRAGPTTNQYVFAFVMPLSLIAVTVFTSMRIADKLDEEFLEEIASVFIFIFVFVVIGMNKIANDFFHIEYKVAIELLGKPSMFSHQFYIS
ncbi:hypothetical protein PRUPE_2G027100 [Prunus persica]|uniref:Uncharacterized protein n=1 Tax=Prunus persica TaxID=3760 RepID=A0A251Q9Y3_PRUPE|nr:hypothetical protein PRUPE_2G027100 [Prunus persica]